MTLERDGPEETSTYLCSGERRGLQAVRGGWDVSFNTAPPERLRPIQHPSLSIFVLFTSRFMSLHANSITGIKIVCPIVLKLRFPCPSPSLNPSHHLQAFRSQGWARGLQDKQPERPKETRGGCVEECSNKKSEHYWKLRFDQWLRRVSALANTSRSVRKRRKRKWRCVMTSGSGSMRLGHLWATAD